jgi:hypothetical protein
MGIIIKYIRGTEEVGHDIISDEEVKALSTNRELAGIVIKYFDEQTGDELARDFISEVRSKALGTDMVSGNPAVVFFNWLSNSIHNKARQCIDNVVKEALEDSKDEILTKAEKQEIVQALASQGRIISTVKGMPEDVKRQIVAKARVKSGAEKNAEADEEMRRKAEAQEIR